MCHDRSLFLPCLMDVCYYFGSIGCIVLNSLFDMEHDFSLVVFLFVPCLYIRAVGGDVTLSNVIVCDGVLCGHLWRMRIFVVE